MKLMIVGGVALFTLSGVACSTQPSQGAPCPSQVVTIEETPGTWITPPFDVGCDLRPEQRLDVRLYFDPNYIPMGNSSTFERCENLGGAPVAIEEQMRAGRLLCVEVTH